MPHRPSVKPSRAGDIFHYRWAARRCLRLLDPQYGLESITVEGSKQPSSPGELVIDLSEYYSKDKRAWIIHYQLKHSTVRTHIPLQFSELKRTFEGFAARYRAALKNSNRSKKPLPTFTFVSNRTVSSAVKAEISVLARGKDVTKDGRLQQATQLSGAALRDFCRRIIFLDDEGDYQVQKRKLEGEVSEFLAGFVDGDDADLLVNLVVDRVMPKSENGKRDGQILPEAVIRKLGARNKRDLYPAPAVFDELPNPIRREQHAEIVRHILAPGAPSIIHAEGGVGKSVVARLVAESLPAGSRAVVYDCFGSGNYLSPSEPRHRARDALLQIANELAALGLCRILIPRRGLAADDYFRDFINRLTMSVKKLREIAPKANLVLLIDAADNAEMAAQDQGEQCFASALLRQKLPPGCRLAMFARTERVKMLKPGPEVRPFPLAVFSRAESLLHLRRSFRQATTAEGREFERLSGGNPRVQANALQAELPTVAAVLANLGPNVTTLNAQIGRQLNAAVNKVKARHTTATLEQVDAICYGLANLPPLIPIPVLAQAAGVPEEAIKSFVADLGRPLWASDNAVRFRDEPTETWFRQQFAANDSQVKSYADRIAPLAATMPYVAKALPLLLLRAKELERLVALALSDDHLPTNNAIEKRNVRVYRLQFAFKAALKLRRFADAAQLAFRAGEEVAGDERQTELLGQNLDLVAALEESNRVQEIAYRQQLGSGWPGCENIYSAALLSSFPDFQGDAQAFLRTSRNWLQLYFEEEKVRRKKKKKPDPFGEVERLTDEHVLELWWAQFNLYGAKGLVDYVAIWTPVDLPLKVMAKLFSRLVDAGRFNEIDAIAEAGAHLPYLMLAAAEGLIAVGRTPPGKCLRSTLAFFADPKRRPEKPKRSALDDRFWPALAAFLEACAGRRLPVATILAVLEYNEDDSWRAILGSDHQEGGRGLFLRAASLRAVLRGEAEPTVAVLFPPPPDKKPNAPRDRDDDNRNQMLASLLPWHFARTRLIVQSKGAATVDLKALESRASYGTHSRYREFDRLPNELNAVRFEVLAWKTKATAAEVKAFRTEVIDREPRFFWLPERLKAARVAFRLPHLKSLRAPLENSCSTILEPKSTESPEERANWYVELGRAVLAVARDDAAAYFEKAVDSVSKFGEEIVARWEAVVAVANRSAEPGRASAESVYRLVRCAEMVGETVAREKYWDRDDVFRLVLQLEPAAAFAALSRWRDREVGWFNEQLEALAIAAVKERKTGATATWCLSGFSGCHASRKFAETCLETETNLVRRQALFERIVRDFELSGMSTSSWRELREVAKKLKLHTSRLDHLIANRVEEKEPTDRYGTSEFTRKRKAAETKRWRQHFRGRNVVKAEALEQILKKANRGPHDPEILWQELLRRVPKGSERKFLRLLAACPELGYFDSGYATKQIRAGWIGKAVVRLEWPLYLQSLGRRFSAAFADRGSIPYWEREGRLDVADALEIRKGMLQGLSDSLELATAETFFGFVTNMSGNLTKDEAQNILAFALGRFELHMDLATYADGPFRPELIPPTDVPAGMAGMVRSALGSPYAETRWEAAHCVRRWAELGCDAEIDALIAGLSSEEAGAFGGWNLPFYSLHFKLYLFIALARAAVSGANLDRHARVFAGAALGGPPHYLIQRTAADIALELECRKPGTYPATDVAKINLVGKSQLPPRDAENSTQLVDSPRHARNEVDQTLQFHFGMDFGNYWLGRLGRVFGVSQKQTEELAREIIVKELGGKSSDDYVSDPRQSQWRDRDRSSDFYKSSYPRIDDHRFYLGYHAMHRIAGELLGTLPVLHDTRDSWHSDEWASWTRLHGLTRSDGRWLSDRRDPDPDKRRPWVRAGQEPNWMWQVSPDDFRAIIQDESPLPKALCIDGYWTDCVQDRQETIRVDSALVEPSVASALANSLRNAKRNSGFNIPEHEGNDDERGKPPFDLLGWVFQTGGDDPRLDSFDPYAKQIQFPPPEIGETISRLLGVTHDVEKREWRKGAGGPVCALAEIWSDHSQKERYRREEPNRFGRRMTATVALLRELCAATKRDLIIRVGIERRRDDSYKPSFSEYVPPSHKIFLLSSNGRLQDSAKSYPVG